MSHDGTGAIPPYQPAGASPGATPGTLTCPKCGGVMRTYDRNGIHLEQCQTCRGIFLDFGELEHLTQLEARMTAPPQPAAPQAPAPGYGYGYDGPGWGHRGNYRYRKGGFSRMFFSS
ncbi:MAG: zf-TFIIB domain-containing protein [Phycicoccus sp.]|nr:zf-TFIIB domain-containing protein [Phycicoccus sp.]